MSSSASPNMAARRTRIHRAADTFVAKLLKLPVATSSFVVRENLKVPMRDGAVLLADHVAPIGTSRGTILVRGPYGFNAVGFTAFGGVLARYGYDVVLARTRGTFGSGGDFVPFAREMDDAADTVQWLREQPFFGGSFATFGGSYVGFTQWALLMDPPPELTACVMQVSPHDVSASMYHGGAFNLDLWLGWCDQIVRQEGLSLVKAQVRASRSARRQKPANAVLPVADAADKLCEGRAPWFREWVTERDLTHPQ